MSKAKKNSAVISILTGTAALCLCWFFWPHWLGIFITLIAIILAIIAIIYGKKSKKYYKQNQESLKKEYYRNAKMGFNLGVAGLIISSICFVLAILFTIYLEISV